MSWILVLLASAAAAAPTERAPAPGDGCVDTRTVLEARHLDERSVLLKSAHAGYRVELAEACPPSDGADLVAVAPHGWVCGGEQEFVRVADRLCAIKTVAAVSERDWALALRDHAQGRGGATLNTVTVEAKVARKRRFAASTDYCVDPRRVRGWNVKGREIVVNTAPMRGSDDASSYRLELGRSCPEADFGSQLSLISGVGIGWICGHPGDTAIISGRFEDLSGGTAAVDLQQAMLQPSILNGAFARQGCPIIAVYPLR